MKRKKELIVILSSLLVIVLSVSVAYFTTKILGTGKEISVESADLKVIFTSGSGEINGTNIEPGWSSGENTFTVKNESNGTYNYDIVIKDLLNTFTTSGFLVYKITSSDGGYNMADFVDVPKSSTATDTTIAESISISKGATHTYKVEFKYLESKDVDQSADMGKKLSGKIFITEEGIPTLAKKLLKDNPTISERTDFSTPFTTNTTNTLYKATENGKDVYYFAGADFVSAHCKYNDKKITNYDSSNAITKEICQAELTLCEIGDTLYYEHSDCSGKNGTTITVTEGKWIEDEEKPINNWVKFGGYYWRIIRTNADGSIRLLYSGTSPDTIEGYIGESVFNTTSIISTTGNTPKDVGYMYGNNTSTLEEARTNTNDSVVKKYIDNWYENNLTSYTNYLSNDAVYCNDRELASDTEYLLDDDFNFKTYDRLDVDNGGTNASPTYDCTNIKDAFSINNTEAKLKYPVALMTADEGVYAGGTLLDSPMWYYTNSEYKSITGNASWWVFSPFFWTSSRSFIFEIGGSDYLGRFLAGEIGTSRLIRPVTSLKSCVTWKSGNGSANNPYEIEMNGGC